LGLAIFSTLLAAQPAGQPASIFGETIDVRVINVEVVVTDKDGNPVLGLGPEDFRLTVDGEPVAIDYFTEIRGGVAVGPQKAQEAEKGPGGLPSIVPGQPVPTSYLLFIDEYFSLGRDRDQVLQRMLDQLPLLGPQDRMAVVAYDGTGLEMLSSWSQSTSDLRRTLQKAIGRPAFGLARQSELRSFEGIDVVDDFRRPFELSFQEQQYAQVLANQVRRSVLAATATLRGFAAPPGRKVMLMLSGGWPFSPARYAANDSSLPINDPSVPDGNELFSPLIRTANLLGYTLYPVDVPGLDSESFADAQRADVVGTAPSDLTFREQLDEDSLHYVADQTGGRALLDASRFAAFETAVEDTRTYYWLGFNSERKSDDKPRRIEVDVVGKGLKARSRDSLQELSRTEEVDLAVESALLFGSPPGFDNLPVASGEMKRDGRRFVLLPVKVAIPVDMVTLVPRGEERVGQLELRIAAVSDDGDQSDIPVIPLSVRLDEEPASGQFIPYETTLRLRNQKQRVIVALYDLLGNSLHSNSFDLKPMEKKKR
jgi:VWFA-related protein